jgi:hypothetical protein
MMAAEAVELREPEEAALDGAAGVQEGTQEVEIEPPLAVVEGPDDEAAALALEGEAGEGHAAETATETATAARPRCLGLRWCPSVESENMPRIEYTLRCVLGTVLLSALFFRPGANETLGLSGYAPGAGSNAAFFSVMTMEYTLGRSLRSLAAIGVAIVVAGSICAALRAAVPYRE